LAESRFRISGRDRDGHRERTSSAQVKKLLVFGKLDRLGSIPQHHPEVNSAVWTSINPYNRSAAKRDQIEATVNAYLIVQSRAAGQFGIETVRAGFENIGSRLSISSRLGNAGTKGDCQ
jgi:hypothetical protein